MITRRAWFAAATAGLAALRAALRAAHGQPAPRVRRIGLLGNGSVQPSLPAPVQALRDALRELGYVEGSTLEIEYRWAEGQADRLPRLAAELVRARVELIVASGDAPIRAAMPWSCRQRKQQRGN